VTNVLNQALVVARRDFMAVVATPTFIIFLLAPLLMLALGLASGSGAAYLATSAEKESKVSIVAIVDPVLGAKLLKGDARLRGLYRQNEGPPELRIVAPKGDLAAQTKALFDDKDIDVTAVMSGPLRAPQITHQPPSDRHARYFATLAEEILRAEKSGVSVDAKFSIAKITAVQRSAPSKVGKQASGFGAVVIIFMLTLILASQSIGMLAEEKSNKVIEILAAAVPLEAVFLGKLIGMFGVAMLFIAFWGTLTGLAFTMVPAQFGLAGFVPAIGLPTFVILCGVYFTMAFMLLSAVFLGIGAQASTMREIQMMSLPVTIFQMAMFGLAAAAAGKPGSSIATIAQIFPFSSPFAMAARGATDATLWPHLLAIAWQALWVAITIWIAARLFRIGVLKSGSGFKDMFGRRTKAKA
jgi:ABC-2 type transport system permease protein